MLTIKKHIVIPIFVPHKGCPFDCIFCNQKIISGQIEEVSEKEIRKTIEDHLKTSEESFVEIGFYGGSFTGIPKYEQERYLQIGYSYIEAGKVKQMRISTRPDYINNEILDLLEKYHVRIIELGAQSLDNEVLQCSNRGHSIETVVKAAKLIKSRGFQLGIQTMIGLPGDSREKAINTAQKVVEMQPNIVRIYPTLVIKNTYLLKMYLDGKYKPLSVEEAVDISAELLSIYDKNNINVIRIGLQPTDNISEQGEVVAGPFHPAFRQLVQSKLILNKIILDIQSKHLDDAKSIKISCNPREMSNIIGNRKSNIDYLKSKFNLEKITVKAEDYIDLFEISNT